MIKHLINNIFYKKKVTKEIFWATCAKGVSISGGLFVLIFVPKVAGVEIFGSFSLILAYILIFGVLSGVPVQAAIKKEVTEGKWNTLSKRYFIESIKIKFMASIVSPLLVYLAIDIFNINVLKENFLLFLLLLITRNFWGSIVTTLEAVHRLFYVAIIYIVEWAVKITAIILFYNLYGLTVKTLLLSFFIGYFSAFIVGLGIILKNYQGIEFREILLLDRLILIQILKRAFYLSLTSLTGVLLARIDVIMISHYLSFEYIGWYNIASDISKQMTIISVPFILGTIPLFVSDKEPHRLLFTSLKKLFVINLIIFFFIFFGSKYIILLLFGEQFLNVVVILKILAIFPLCAAMQHYMQQILILYDKTNRIFLFGVFAVALNIALNTIFIPLYSINGAAVATIVSYVIWVIISFVYLNMLLNTQRRDTAVPG